jgi:uncharacterized Zn finger protein
MSKKKKYALRTPLNVKGGIRSQAPAGGHARAWWSRRWTEVIERFRLGARLGRGRNYAVTGQVSSLEVAPGRVAARVQGASREPYESTIRFHAVEGEAKAGLIREMRRRPMLVARLLVSDLPFEVEGLFREAGCPLFPQREHDLTSRCSCPDYANPCKHLAAVYYLLGEAIAKNPLLLLALRGVGRAELLGESLECSSKVLTCGSSKGGEGLEDADNLRISAEGSFNALKCESAKVNECEDGDDNFRTLELPNFRTSSDFYGTPQPPFEDFGTAVKSVTHAPLIYRLGPLPFWRGQERFTDTLEHLYARAAARGWAVWTGEPLDLRREEEKVVITGANLHLKNRRLRVDISLT